MASSSTATLRPAAAKPRQTSPFDPDSPLFVAKGIGASAITGAAMGAVAGFQANANAVAASVQMGQRWVVMGSAFFATREYIVSPLLLASGATRYHARRLAALSDKQRGKLPQGPMDVGEIKHNRVLDSALTGAITFGVYSAVTRGPRVVPRASLTAALLASLLQYSVNYSRLARLHLLSASSSSDEDDAVEQHIPSLGAQLKQSSEEPFKPLQVADEHTLASRILGVMSYVAPITKITRQEAYEKLLEERKSLDRRIEAIEIEENALYEAAQRRFEERQAAGMGRV